MDLDNLKKLKFFLAGEFRRLTKNKYQFEICSREAVTIFGHSFAPDGHHFIIQFLNESYAKTRSHIARSAISCFHENFCPTSTGEALGLDLENDLPLFLYPWGVFGSGAIKTAKTPYNSRFCGPSSKHFIIEEENRICDLFSKLQKHGYAPDKYPNSYIQGVWLVKENGCRKFVVLQGNHRMACLSFLGYSKILVRTDMFRVREVYETDAKAWPLVRSGLISERDALLIFNKFFK